jgi:hypothetical protein
MPLNDSKGRQEKVVMFNTNKLVARKKQKRKNVVSHSSCGKIYTV